MQSNDLPPSAAAPAGDAILWTRRFAWVLLGLTAARVLLLILARHELGADEAQYWFWSLTPAAGYYSKPPMIAWAIGATTALFGDGEAAVRLASPIFHAGSAALLFILGRDVYGSKTGFWAGVSWLLLPGVVVSATLISTDALMLFFWSAALVAFFRLARGTGAQHYRWTLATGLGAALGLGFLSKYAIVYFPIGAALAFVIAPSFRKRIKISELGLAGVVAAVIAAPNLIWNARHEFRTVSHTVANANWGGDMFHPAELAEFLGAQFGVAGPMMLPVMAVAGLAVLGRIRAPAPDAGTADRERALLAFALPVLAIVAAQAFASRAHANWGAAAYPSALVVATGVALRAAGSGGAIGKLFPAIRASVALHTVIAAIYAGALASPALADRVGLGAAFKGLRGWAQHGDDVAAYIAAAPQGYDAVVSDDRDILGALLYYYEGAPRVAAFDSNWRIDHHYEAFLAFDPTADRRVLYVTDDATALALKDRFSETGKVGESVAPLGAGRTRTLYFFSAEGYIPSP